MSRVFKVSRVFIFKARRCLSCHCPCPASAPQVKEKENSKPGEKKAADAAEGAAKADGGKDSAKE